MNYSDPQKVKSNFLNSNFCTLNVNIRSLNSNFEKLETLLSQLDFDPNIICITETWISQDKPFIYKLKGYNFISNLNNSRAGGSGLFIKDNINYKLISLYDLKIQNCEDIWVDLTISTNKHIVIGSIYRHPVYDINEFKNKFAHIIEKLNKSNKTFIVSGDFNIDLNEKSAPTQNYIAEIESQGSWQTVTNLTRVSNRTKSSLIDHVYTNIHQNKISSFTLSYDISDHLPVISFINFSKIPNYKTTQKNFTRDKKTFVTNDFLLELKNKLNLLNTTGLSGNQRWEDFESVFNSVLDKHAPLRTCTRREMKRKNKPWMSNELLNSVKIKQKLYKKFLTCPSDINNTTYKKFSNKLTHSIKYAKQQYFQNKIRESKSDGKKIWQTINEIVDIKNKTKTNNIVLSDENDNPITNPVDISNTFNKYFTSIGANLCNASNYTNNPNFYNVPTSPTCPNSLYLNLMTVIDVKSYIINMKINKATKSDCPSIKYIKLSIEIISPYICDIFNQCIQEGIFPDNLKSAEVIPIFKRGNKTKTGNFRPISILSPFSQIFERHIHQQISAFISKYKLIHPFQYGFQENSSTEIALQQLSDDLLSKLDNNQLTCATFIDLRKAFDSVHHGILISKFNKFGIRGLPAKLLTNYLSNRNQSTIINGVKSDTEPITCGVPQGSILGPLLFLMFINDLPQYTNFDVRLFADDACLIYTDTNYQNLQNVVNSELNKVNNYLTINKLSINYDKSHYLIFSRKKKLI